MFAKTILMLILLISPSQIIFAQGEANIMFLLMPTSPKLNAAGAAGTASLVNDPYKFFFNPAHLGYSSRDMNIASGFYPSKTNWLPVFQIDGLNLNSYVFNAGFNFEKIYPNVPISIGFGYSKSEFNYGILLIAPEAEGPFDSKDYYSAYSFGIGYSSMVNVSAGITIKDVTSILSEQFPVQGNNGQVRGTAEVTAIDYGFLINLPLNNLLKQPLKFDISNSSSITTDLNYTLGYTIQNVGDEVYYVDPGQSDPIGRTARLAHNIQFGASIQTPEYELRLINFSYSIDAEDILIERIVNPDSTSRKDYQGLMGDIKFGRNLLLGKGNREVVLHKGMMVEFFEILSIAEGGFDGRGFDNRKTNGMGFRLKGILKLINLSMESETVKFMVDHFDVEYYNTSYFSGHMFESEFSGMTVTISGF